VKRQASSKGVGSQLMKEFVKVATTKAATEIILTTDAHNNESVNNFYLKHGFQLVRQFDRTNERPMNEYALEIDSSNLPRQSIN
jgi:ribosomal protein S18 acetylase RimI-like enzyme